MFQAFKKYVNFLIFVSALTGCFGLTAAAQFFEKPVNEVEVPILKKFGSRYLRCYVPNQILDEDTFKRILASANLDQDCAAAYKMLDVDFARQTLIGYSVGGDCFLRVRAGVFRDDAAKKFTVRIRNIWGGCRAGGGFRGLLVIEKIPSTYKVEFVETKVTGFGEKAIDEDVFNLNSPPRKKNAPPKLLETRSFEMKNCIQLYRQNKYIIKDQETYLKTIRNDASRDRCLKELEKIDFGKHTLIGMEINSGYCGFPLGLAFQTFKDEAKKKYLLSISYIAPDGGCRALSEYDLWVLVPKLPDGFEVGFEVTATPSLRNQ